MNNDNIIKDHHESAVLMLRHHSKQGNLERQQGNLERQQGAIRRKLPLTKIPILSTMAGATAGVTVSATASFTEGATAGALKGDTVVAGDTGAMEL